LHDLRAAVRVGDCDIQGLGFYCNLGLAVEEQQVIQELLGGS
jgi:hypothetical protein